MPETKTDKFNSEKWTLPANLRMTKAMREQAAVQQQEFAAKTASPFGSLSPAEFERSKAAIAIAENERLLAAIEAAPNKSEFAETVPIINRLLAENYATVGLFDKAVMAEPNPARRNEFEQILKALKRKDSEWCKCGNQGGDIPVSNVYVKQNIWSVKLNKEIPLLACRNCGEMNAVETIPPDIQKTRIARARARELAGQMSPADARTTLINNNHTTREILGEPGR